MHSRNLYVHCLVCFYGSCSGASTMGMFYISGLALYTWWFAAAHNYGCTDSCFVFVPSVKACTRNLQMSRARENQGHVGDNTLRMLAVHTRSLNTYTGWVQYFVDDRYPAVSLIAENELDFGSGRDKTFIQICGKRHCQVKINLLPEKR